MNEQPMSAKPENARPMNAQAVNTQPASAQSMNAPSMNTQAMSAKPMNTQPMNAQPVNAQPVSTQPMNAQAMNVQPVNTQAMSAHPMNAQPMNAQPVNTQAINAQPVSAQPMNAQAMNAQQMNAQPINAQPVNAQPKIQYMMSFPDALNSCFKKYINFNGRASRAEFWWFSLLNIIYWSFILVQIMSGAISQTFVKNWGILLALPLGIPFYMAGTRRLHDIGRTGWWQLLYLTIFGGILITIWACFKSHPAPNKYGDVPCKLK